MLRNRSLERIEPILDILKFTSQGTFVKRVRILFEIFESP